MICLPAVNVMGLWPFASPWMLLWGAAAIVPLVIHLWSRRRYDEVPWAAMKFLMAAIRKNARRWRMEQLLLLFVRVLILLLLAVALADPVLTLFGAPGSMTGEAGDRHTVVVIDASYSMDYRHADATRFDLAKGLASELVRDARQGDGFTLVRMAAPPDVVIAEPVFDREEVAGAIGDLQRTDGGADLAATLAEIERLLDRAIEREPRLKNRRVVFFTDMQRTTWGDVTGDAVRAVVARLGTKAELRVRDVGESGGQNVAVINVSSGEAAVTLGLPVRFDIELENLGNQDRPREKVELLLDGQRIAEDNVDVPAGGRSGVSAEHRFQIPGEHVVEVRLADDRLEVDNHRWLSLTVRPALEVLCVEGKSGAAKNVTLALEPASSQQPTVRPVVQSEIALLEEDLQRYDCIFLCNVGRFGRDEARLLYEFLERGGGVVLFLGDQVQPANYNAILGAGADSRRILPVNVGDPVDLGDYALDPLDYQHPIVAPFRDHPRAGLLTTPIWKYVKLERAGGDDVQVAVAFRDGDPAILEAPVGRGRVIVVATDGSSTSVDPSTTPPTPWSALAAWPSFPPLVQQMLTAAVRGRAELRNARVGDTLRGTIPSSVVDTSVEVADPGGRTQRVPAQMNGGATQWTYTDTLTSGVYLAHIGGPAGQIHRYAVNVDTRESRLERFDMDLLPSQFQRSSANAVETDTTVAAPSPSHYYRYVLATVLALLLVESLLAWRFGSAVR